MSSKEISMTECSNRAHAPSDPGKGPCALCGHPRCNGTTKTGRCRKWPIKDAAVCRTHGGSAPQVRAAAEARQRDREAVLATETFGLPVPVDAHTALLEELHRTAGAVQWLSAVVADLERDDLVWGRIREVHGVQQDEGQQAKTTKQAGTNAFVRLWQEERRHLVLVAKACVDVGIEERRVQLAEAAGQQLASVIRAVLDRLGLTDEQRSLALVVVPEEFRRLGEGGGAA